MPESSSPDMVLITHAHIDHSNAVPMLMRHDTGRLSHIFAPAKVINRLREYAQLSFSMKVDYDLEVPPHYCTPPRIFSNDGEPVYAPWEETKRRWRPVEGGLTVPVAFGKGGKQIMVIQTVTLLHNRCSTIGYLIFEKKSKLMPHLEGIDKKTTTANVMQAKSRGEAVTMDVNSPVMAFICDTSIEAVTTGDESSLILSMPALMIECTYLEESMNAEATKRGHVCWSQLCPVVISKLRQLREVPFTAILIHFSLRYTDGDIVAFFMNPDLNGLGRIARRKTAGVVTFEYTEGTFSLYGDSGEAHKRSNTVEYGPCHLVLWLDSGVEEIWFQNWLVSVFIN